MRTINLSYPTCWEEIGKRDLRIISKTLLLRLSREEMLFVLFCRLTGIRLLLVPGEDEGTTESVYFFKKRFKKFPISTALIQTACKELEFILDSYGLPGCPLKDINEKLYDIRFREYFYADAFFTRYVMTHERAYLRESLRTLVGGKRFIRSSLLYQYAIWFTGVKYYLKTQYVNLFDDSEGECSHKTPADQLVDILSALNKEEPQNNEAILNSEVHAVLRALDNVYYKIKHANKGIH